jgi:molybdopterin synthase catalytic subunit
MTRAAITTDPIDAAAVLARVASVSHGATVLFVGTVRDHNEGQGVSGLDYTAYEAMALDELDRIVGEAHDRFDGASVAAVHRVGTLGPGEVSVAVAASHAHRASAFDAARYVIEEVKRRLPVWKREHYVDGTREWVAPATGGPGHDLVRG